MNYNKDDKNKIIKELYNYIKKGLNYKVLAG
jgi:hypothetical protein